jgi:hypothetical protein
MSYKISSRAFIPFRIGSSKWSLRKTAYAKKSQKALVIDSAKLPMKLPAKLPMKLPMKLPAKLPMKLPEKLPAKLPANSYTPPNKAK